MIVCNNGEPFSIEGVESLMLSYYTSKSERESKQTFKSPIINDQIEELLEKRKSMYNDYPERIQSDYITEYETVGAYHGREILELPYNRWNGVNINRKESINRLLKCLAEKFSLNYSEKDWNNHVEKNLNRIKVQESSSLPDITKT